MGFGKFGAERDLSSRLSLSGDIPVRVLNSFGYESNRRRSLTDNIHFIMTQESSLSMRNPFAEEPYVPKRIPRHELIVRGIRGGGKGGQKVNKVASTGEVIWIIDDSTTYTDEEKMVIRQKLATKISKNRDDRQHIKDQIRVTSQDERYQSQNIEDAIERLQSWVAEALRPEKPRVEGMTDEQKRSANLRRLQEKAMIAGKKSHRRADTGKDW